MDAVVFLLSIIALAFFVFGMLRRKPKRPIPKKYAPRIRETVAKKARSNFKRHEWQRKPYGWPEEKKYTVANRQKYIGNENRIIGRSGWEMSVFEFMDMHPNVIKWSSEEKPVRYYDPVRKRFRTYWPDIYFETVQHKRYLVEIKPAKYTVVPTVSGDVSRKKYQLYLVNKAKWAAASRYAKRRDIVFQIWSEDRIKEIRRIVHTLKD